MKRINVLIVDDSAFMRKLIADFLTEDPRIHIIGTARNGEDGLKKTIELKPDVVTMDVEMPVLNGLDALKLIMEKNPVPVLMLSSTTKEGAENTIQAIAYGAIDFIAKPSGAISLDLHKIKQELIEKVVSVSSANIKQLVKYPLEKKIPTNSPQNYSKIEPTKILGQKDGFKSSWKPTDSKIVCIGTSTGGPRALQAVLTRLPSAIPAPIVIVQHMPAGFTHSLANRLNHLSQITVKEAEDGEILQKGTAYIAPGGYHLQVMKKGTSLQAKLNQAEARNGHRPSVDVMFESVSMIEGFAKVAVIMTGMGSDGSKGLMALKEKGNVKAIAESEESSIVYGMPKSAIATNLVDEVKKVDLIAEAIIKYV
ncbi:protein-glutamate methylesterase/protein-glutamine glutaminase [Cytobacillus gottheilii]|uniref:Protein-glutamate methylesterase/protein-glutamine glutaminase n=1 Tax=Cytobacillus gottheilii TaxID=859144 RepID=A0ABX8FH12_9BACI|nr:chemotaxis response regulator protein-glutamate methylesterase [Cytobacillus gottheilii]QVY63309.1 chemotaxis response regulator protein-glutamate methylesterase [Cytobacillus gottheilii]